MQTGKKGKQDLDSRSSVGEMTGRDLHNKGTKTGRLPHPEIITGRLLHRGKTGHHNKEKTGRLNKEKTGHLNQGTTGRRLRQKTIPGRHLHRETGRHRLLRNSKA